MNKIRASAVVLLLVIVAATAAWIFLGNTRGPAVTPDPITIGIAPLDNSALFYIAEDQHFFSDNHLAVTLREYNPPSDRGNRDDERRGRPCRGNRVTRWL